MALPIIYPMTPGPGRLLEICSFRRSSIPESHYNEVFNAITAKSSKFPIARQFLSGRKSNKEERDITVMIADWTSAEEKDNFEPGEEYQGIKPAFGELVDAENPTFACHHIILPGAGVTPEAERYVAEFLSVPVVKQRDFAWKLQTHVEFLVGDVAPVFFYAAPSRENAEIVVVVSGWKTSADAEVYVKDTSKKLQGNLESVCTGVIMYQADLKKWEPSK